MNSVEQSVRDKNIAAIVRFFEGGIKQQSRLLGIELEHILTKKDGAPVSYSEHHGVRWVLEQLKKTFPDASYDEEGNLLGVSRKGQSVTIEPAAQIELSAGPFDNLDDAHACFTAFEKDLENICAAANIQVHAIGYHPTARACDLELIPKTRYDLMNRYLGGISEFGIDMMRGSAATQVSIDYTSTQDALTKMRVAYALVPLFSLMCDTATSFRGSARNHHMVRTEIWQFCDPDRSGIVPGIMNDSFSLEDYAAYILDAPAILVKDEHGKSHFETRTFGEIYAHSPMTRAQVEHALSMFFTDVRLKTYVEIRPADSMPIPFVLAYTALIKGLFYSEDNLQRLAHQFAALDAPDIEAGKHALMEHGYAGKIYGKPASEWADMILSMAKFALSDNDKHYLEPLETLVAARTTLAMLHEQEQ